MDSKMLFIDCWVYGDCVDEVFPVEISSTKSIGSLKNAIKEAQAPRFDDRIASMLKLYRFSIRDDQQLELLLGQWNPRDKTALNGRTKLSNLFCEVDNLAYLIIVNAPTLTPPSVVTEVLTLNCWVRGQETHRTFPVEVSSTKTVYSLQEAIKHKLYIELRDIQANALALYKVSLSCNGGLAATLKGLTFDRDTPLYPLDTLSDVFSQAPLPKHVHIVVEAPHPTRFYPHTPSSIPSLQIHGLQAQRRSFLCSNPPMAPSSGGKLKPFTDRQSTLSKTIYCNRPHTACATIPVTLLHIAFGEFLDDCDKYEVTMDDISFAEDLHFAMSDFYSSERARAQEIRNILATRGLPIGVTVTNDGYITDGDMSVNGHRYVILEFKNEVSSTGAEPYNQACLYYLECTRNYAETRWNSALPCMIILFFGPYIAFAGATWNACPVVQPLSFTLSMHYHPTDTTMRTRVARHLGAFKKAVCKLGKYYQGPEFAKVASSPLQILFPHPTSFKSLKDNDNRSQGFEYECQPFADKLFFFGTLGSRPICIKFVRQYSKDVHERCVSLECAPDLLGFEEIPGGWFMVVMDRLIDREWECIAFRNGALSASLIPGIRNAIVQLHQNGYVHGDIRNTNIMVSRTDKTKFRLVDFDWAGKIGVVRYPINLNRGPGLWRPQGAISGDFITAGHDIEMLDHIEHMYPLMD